LAGAGEAGPGGGGVVGAAAGSLPDPTANEGVSGAGATERSTPQRTQNRLFGLLS
jgi:hypothetical protein